MHWPVVLTRRSIGLQYSLALLFVEGDRLANLRLLLLFVDWRTASAHSIVISSGHVVVLLALDRSVHLLDTTALLRDTRRLLCVWEMRASYYKREQAG
jgi:hypothetical protein